MFSLKNFLTYALIDFLMPHMSRGVKTSLLPIGPITENEKPPHESREKLGNSMYQCIVSV